MVYRLDILVHFAILAMLVLLGCGGGGYVGSVWGCGGRCCLCEYCLGFVKLQFELVRRTCSDPFAMVLFRFVIWLSLVLDPPHNIFCSMTSVECGESNHCVLSVSFPGPLFVKKFDVSSVQIGAL